VGTFFIASRGVAYVERARRFHLGLDALDRARADTDELGDLQHARTLAQMNLDLPGRVSGAYTPMTA
jgi:hypothetical protein